MKVLVTGGGGFLGRYIVEQLLEQNNDVIVFSRGDYPDLKKMGVKLIRGDLQDQVAVNQACLGLDAVFHVAAKAGYWGSWESFYQPNVLGTENIIAACQKQGVPKIIYTSTPSVVANQQDRAGADESLPYPTHFESFYPHTKSIAEKLIMQANSPNLLTVALRPHIIFGPRDTQIVPRLIARARAGKLIQIGQGHNKVDVTYVEDAARAHLLAAEALEPNSALAGSAYFISQDNPVNLWDFIHDLLTRLDIPPVKRQVSLPLARKLGHTLEFFHGSLRLKGEPRLTRFLADELALSHYYDISRAKHDFNYKPQVTLDEAINRTVEFFANH